MKVICQKWEESERGWGVRPDGYSLHLNHACLKAYLDKIYKSRDSNDVPDEYERISGTPYEVEIDDVTLKKMKAPGNEAGLRFYNNNYPGSGGTDGWMKE